MEEMITILIVDDEPMGREALEGVFYSQGYQLIYAETGQEAYEKALDFTPDVVLLDVMMPNMDGFEVCRMMRSHPLLEEIPILIVTALDDRESRIRGIEAGADDFITKPFDRVELRSRVRTITRLNRYRRLLVEKARFSWVVDQATEGYLILDEPGRILYANLAARTLLGLPDEEEGYLSMPFKQFVEESFRCEPEADWRSWGNESEYESKLVFLIQPETEISQPIWLELRTLSLPGGNGRNRLLRITPVTEQIYSLLEMWNFHSFLTHKLRTPISNVTLAAQILVQHGNLLAREEIAEIAQGLFVSGRKIEGELNGILKFIHAPRISQGLNPVSISELTTIIEKVKDEIGINDISINIDPQIPTQRYVKLSAFAVEIIFFEILANSQKFHPTLTPRIDITIRQQDAKSISISIQDDGTHLSPYQLSHAFVPYFQAEKYFTGEVEGIGLGLATVASIVWGSGGDCRLSNRKDSEGIVVWITSQCMDPEAINHLSGSITTKSGY